jgi:anti-anti-sigma factor
MDIAVEDLAGGATRIALRGRLDTTAAVLIELPFNTVATEKKAIVVDLSAVDFLSSGGIRVLLLGAKIAASKGGKLTIVCPDNNVAKVLNVAGISNVIPVFESEDAALAAVMS